MQHGELRPCEVQKSAVCAAKAVLLNVLTGPRPVDEVVSQMGGTLLAASCTSAKAVAAIPLVGYSLLSCSQLSSLLLRQASSVRVHQWVELASAADAGP